MTIIPFNTLAGEDGMVNQLKDKEIKKFDQKTLNKLKRQFTRRSNKEIKKLCKGDRQTQKELKHNIQKLLDGIQIKENNLRFILKVQYTSAKAQL